MKQWDVYVEGHSDRRFLTCLAEHMEIGGLSFKVIETNMHGLRKMKTQMRRAHDAGRHIATIVDADKDAESSRRELRHIVGKIGVPVSRSFLLPDNKQPGCLETLLESLAVPPHDAVYDCFDAYKKCLRACKPCYRLPDTKARVYAYCSAVGSETSPTEHDYCNRDHWDLDATDLEPLRKFLRSLRS